jgi:hypothetical protein
VGKLCARVPLGFWAGGAHTSAADEAGGGAKGWGFRGGDVKERGREGCDCCFGVERKRKLRELGRFAFFLRRKGKDAHLAQ